MSRRNWANGVAHLYFGRNPKVARRLPAANAGFWLTKTGEAPESIRSIDAIRGTRSRQDGAIETRSGRSSGRPARALDPAQTRRPSGQDARPHEIRLLWGRPRLPD